MMDPKLPNIKNTEEEEEENSSNEIPAPINLQKRKADVEPTRFGDWELNGRCIDF